MLAFFCSGKKSGCIAQRASVRETGRGLKRKSRSKIAFGPTPKAPLMRSLRKGRRASLTSTGTPISSCSPTTSPKIPPSPRFRFSAPWLMAALSTHQPEIQRKKLIFTTYKRLDRTYVFRLNRKRRGPLVLLFFGTFLPCDKLQLNSV